MIDGVRDGVLLFDSGTNSRAAALVTFDQPTTRFGFYLDPQGADGASGPHPERFYTNRLYNDRGPNGTAKHAPYDGDVQALVFDISRFTEPNTWLVCFEDHDSGATPAPCCDPTDNDYNDLIFEVHAFGATPTVPMTMGALKARY